MLALTSSRGIAVLGLTLAVVALVAVGSPGHAAKQARSVDMTGEWSINDELTREARKDLPEPKPAQGFFSRIFSGARVDVGIPGVPVSVPVDELGKGSDDDNEAEPLHSYGRVAVIYLRQRPDQFAIDYGKDRYALYTPEETQVETIDKRKVTTKSSWSGDRYIVRIKADDGSRLSQEFELINDGQQLQWTVVERRKGEAEYTEVAIYDRVD